LNASLGLGVVLSARDEASPVMIGFGRNMQRAAGVTQEAVTAIGGGLKAISTGLLLAGAAWNGGLAFMSTVSGQFSEAVAATGAVAGATTAELQMLRSAAIDAGIATQFSPKQAIVGLGDLAQAGYSARDSIELLRPVLDLAAGSLGKLTPSGAAGLAAQALKAFQIPVSEAGITVDKLLQSVNSFALSSEELPLALGTASRGAQALRQSLDETLISLGLVKNLVPSVERASTAVAVAMEKMVDPKVQAALKGQGAAVVDSAGKFRPFLSVLQDLLPSLDKMTDQKQSAFLQHTFGQEALGGINAILTQIRGGIRTTSGEMIKGADAIKYLRDQFANAGGTAAKFRDALLDTFDGQKKLVKGSLETLAIVAGEPLQKALRPFVSNFLSGLNSVLEFVRKLPESTKIGFAKVAIVVGMLIPALGMLAGTGAIAAMAVGKFAALGFTVGGVASVLGPLAFLIGGVTLALSALGVAYKRDIGGFGSWVRSTVEQAKLAWEGLIQVFSDGGFSGKVREELNRAENQGVKEFVIAVFTWVGRVKNFFREVGSSFAAFVEEARPVVEDFINALSEVGQKLFLVGENDPTKTLGKWERFGAIGRMVGTELGRAAALALRFGAWMLRTGIAAYTWLKPIGDDVLALGADFAALGREIRDIGVEMGLLDAKAEHSFGLFSIVGESIRGFLGLIRIALIPLRALWGAISWLGKGVINIFGGVIEILSGNVTQGITRIMYGIMSIVVQGVLGVLRVVASLGDALLSKVIPGWTSKADVVGKWQASADETMRKSFSLPPVEATKKAEIGAPPPLLAAVNIPSVAVAQAQAQAQGGLGEANALASAAEALASVAERPLNVNVPVTLVTPDGEVLASIVAQGQASSAVRNGNPIASY
jgi:TP901 family phage tail tape measure protein